VPAKNSKDAFLLLQDGSIFFGTGFGAEVDSVGEVVFNTGMVGYCESLTDPSYAGQILCFTYPLMGNYGVPDYGDLDEFRVPRFFESSKLQVKGAVVQEACRVPSHWASKKNLGEWLSSEGVPGIEGVDTRALVTRLREFGVMMGIIANSSELEDIDHFREVLRKASLYDSLDLVKGVSVKKPITYGDAEKRVVLLDCGAKLGIVRNLLARGYQVVRLPYNSSYATTMKYDPQGVVVSNGPGDPQRCVDTTRCVESLIDSDVPLLGVCLGEQIVGMAQGATTFKLKYGHRGQNKPCIELSTGRGYVTSQNHGYALNPKSLSKTDLKPWFINADDMTIEGVQHSSKPCLAVQFHPEARPGPLDTNFVFDRFAAKMERPREEVKLFET